MNDVVTCRPPPVVAVGGMVLDLDGRSLSGPGGQVHLRPRTYLVLAELMRLSGYTVSQTHLAAIVWPNTTPEVSPPVLATRLRMRIMIVRQAMAKVGIPSASLRCVRGSGYRLDGPRQVVRLFTPAQAAALDALAATHPDRAAVAAAGLC